MPHEEMHSSLRGNALESRTPITVIIGSEEEALKQQTLLANHIQDSGIKDANVGCSETNGIWLVHYWRGEWDPWDAPAGEAYDPPTESGYEGFPHA